jgi:ABC-2 type transport system permease protein
VSRPTASPAPSPLRAWAFLVGLSLRRQFRARLMVWIALGLLAFTAFLVVLFTQQGRWTIAHWPYPRRGGPPQIVWANRLMNVRALLPWSASAQSLQDVVWGSYLQVIGSSGFYVFARWLVFSVFVSFLLPLWSLSFAVEGLGREREDNTLIWLLTRPLSRPAVYLAKYLSVLPWALGLNLGGFALLCLLAGPPGRLALELFWPAVALATCAFCALFHLFAACFRRAAVVALLYSFFLETTLGNMPGYWKRVSVGFYARCLMFERSAEYGVMPVRPEFYLPVSGAAAAAVLVGLTVLLLTLGMAVFARKEYLDGR